MRRDFRKMAFVFMIGMSACSTNEQTAKSCAAYYSTEKHIRTVDTKNGNYTIQLIPGDCKALQEIQQRAHADQDSFYKKRLSDIGNNLFFIVKIPLVDDMKSTPGVKENVVRYYQTIAAQQMHLVVDGVKKVTPAYVNYEDDFGLSPNSTLLVCFDQPLAAIKQSLRFTYNDALLGNPGIQATYSQDEISNFPVQPL